MPEYTHPNPTCDIKSFENPSTPQMAYYLGLLWGDGHITKHQIILSNIMDDGLQFYEMIQNLAKFKTYYGDRVSTTRNHKPLFTITLNNTKLAKYLTEMDYKVKSQATPAKILKTIPKDLHRFFWLGLVDADGSIYKKGKFSKLIVCGTYEQDWTDLEQFIDEMKCASTITRTINRLNQKYSIIELYSRYDINHFLTNLYQTRHIDGIGLKRKYEKFLEVKDLCLVKPRSPLNLNGVTEMNGPRGTTYRLVISREGHKMSKNGFKTSEEAALIFDKLSVSLFGHKANTNYPIENYIALGTPNYTLPIYPELSYLRWARGGPN